MSKLHKQTCPIAATLNIVGDRWTLLIIREAFYGATRFREFRDNTGIAKNLLSERLAKLVEDGLLARRDVGKQGTRHAYVLTPKGKSLSPLLAAMTLWGNEHIYGAGEEPVTLVNRKTGAAVSEACMLDSGGNLVERRDMVLVPGPGASGATKARLDAMPDYLKA